MSMYYDKEGKPIDRETFARLFQDESYQRVAFDEVGGLEVSTVWLGADHGHGGGRPVLFETMAFGGPEDQRGERWHTKAEAKEGHEAAVARAKVHATTPATSARPRRRPTASPTG